MTAPLLPQSYYNIVFALSAIYGSALKTYNYRRVIHVVSSVMLCDDPANRGYGYLRYFLIKS
ncbi:hypothetical protein EPA3_170 [Pseudomonas phage vB_PaM_EPA3]|nr:hypothetical protein EPA3_170 [Pseudomonas phage vB_PaM_EPA3]